MAGIVQVHDDNTILSEAQAQEMFGEATALCPAPVEATVTAVQDTLALRISSENLYEMMTLHPNISKGIIKTLVSRLKVLDNIKNIPNSPESAFLSSKMGGVFGRQEML